MASKLSLMLCFILAGCMLAEDGYAQEDVGFYEVKVGNFSAKFTNWGASLVSLFVPDRHGQFADVVLGYDTVVEYMEDNNYFGAIVGRVANRISGAQFRLQGILYNLTANVGINTLHGGKKGFSELVWKVTNHSSDSITFFYHSFDGEEGFPGDLNVTVTYTLSAPYVLSIKMRAKSINKLTPVNLAHHTYWNLGGHTSENLLSDEIQIFASQYTPMQKRIPTGEILSVKNTPYDFLEPTPIGIKMMNLSDVYDMNYVLDKGNSTMKRAARVHDEDSGRVMELSTNESCLQFYTGNHLRNVTGKGGFLYQTHAGLCLESQGFPNFVNQPNFPSDIFGPGQTYEHDMLFTFSTK